jgi:hypothetical protein
MHRILLEPKAKGLRERKGRVGFNLQFTGKADVLEIWGSGKDALEEGGRLGIVLAYY